MKALRLFPSEEEEERFEDLQRPAEQGVTEPQASPLPLRWTLLLWAGALGPRLFTLFFLTDPENAGDGWHGDVYHHWQIAYLTKQIGLFAPGGPRLWDLKGLDYYWGILHPIALVGLFFLTGSIDIILARLLSLAFGVVVVVLIFHLCRRYWGLRVAVAAAAFAAIAPTSVFIDSTGFLEPMGVALCLLGIWLWPKRGLWTGVAWALASMARAEAWIFSVGMVVLTLLKRERRGIRLPMMLTWAAGMLLYMKILLDRTGNPIYPVWWNFLANAVGKWEYRGSLSPTQMAARPWLGALLLCAAVGLAWTMWKRPRGYLFLSFGFGYLVFIGGTLGFTAYLQSWESWFWMERFFLFPYEFGAVLAAIGLFILLPRVVGRAAAPLAIGVSIASLLLVQLEWPPILAMYAGTRPIWQDSITAGQYLGRLHAQPGYHDGVLSLPNANPSLTYVLARFDGVDGRHIVGQLYDPFYYLPAGTTYAEHPGPIGTLLQCWLTTTDTRLWLVDPHNLNYTEFVADHPEWIRQIGEVPAYQWLVEEVNVPRPAPSACQEAARNVGG